MFPTVILDLYEVIFLPLYHGKSELNRNHHLGNMFFFFQPPYANPSNLPISST